MGLTQQQIGKTYEDVFDLSSGRYKANLRAYPQTNYPQIAVVKNQVKIVGKAASDRTFTIAQLNGRTCHIEIKTWEAKDNLHKMRFRGKEGLRLLAQFEWLLQSVDYLALAFYIVCWRHKVEPEQWRLYPVELIPRGIDHIQFRKDRGLFVPLDENNGWPDWLPVVLTYTRLKDGSIIGT